MAKEFNPPSAQDDPIAIRAIAGTTPVVFDSPHSGTQYPGDFAFSCDFALLRTAEDTHVEKLYDFAPALGIAWIEALFPRSYLDAEPQRAEVDVEHARRALDRRDTRCGRCSPRCGSARAWSGSAPTTACRCTTAR